jgi:hypothetical protein
MSSMSAENRIGNSNELQNKKSELDELKLQTERLGDEYRKLFPKVDPAFVYDLILHVQEDPSNPAPVYTVEVFTKQGTDPEKTRDHILQTTGTIPSVYDNGTHYVSTHRISLEILKKLNDLDFVDEVMGDYTGGSASLGARHDRGDWKRIRDKVGKDY